MLSVLPLVKGDQASQTIWARAAAEEPDKAREILDYVSARPQFEAWSKQFSDATLGKSLGNVRAMHNPRHLAGKIQEIIYNDDAKAIDVCVKVLDPVDWAKVEAGGYTGLSIGGGYLKKWADPVHAGHTRYTPRIAEISLVDSPCIASARFLEMQKQDGSVEEILLKGCPRSFAELVTPATFAQRQAQLEKRDMPLGVARGATTPPGRPRLRKDVDSTASLGAAIAARLNKSLFEAANAFAGHVAEHPASVFATKALGAAKGAKETLGLAGSVGGLLSGGAALANRQHDTRHDDAITTPRLRKPKYMTKSALDSTDAVGAAIAARLRKRSDPVYRLRFDQHPNASSTMREPVNRPAGKQQRAADARMPAHGMLSDKQHGERIAAAKARWLKEGHHDLDPHFDRQAKKASGALLGRANKLAAVQHQRRTAWHAVADSQAAYDKVRAHLPADANLMMEVPHQAGLLNNPEGVGEAHFWPVGGGTKHPLYLLHPAEADDWIAEYGKGGESRSAISKAAPGGLISHQSDRNFGIDRRGRVAAALAA